MLSICRYVCVYRSLGVFKLWRYASSYKRINNFYLNVECVALNYWPPAKLFPNVVNRRLSHKSWDRCCSGSSTFAALNVSHSCLMALFRSVSSANNCDREGERGSGRRPGRRPRPCRLVTVWVGGNLAQLQDLANEGATSITPIEQVGSFRGLTNLVLFQPRGAGNGGGGKGGGEDMSLLSP